MEYIDIAWLELLLIGPKPDERQLGGKILEGWYRPAARDWGWPRKPSWEPSKLTQSLLSQAGVQAIQIATGTSFDSG